MSLISPRYLVPHGAFLACLATLLFAAAPARTQDETCEQPPAVCAARDAVFAVSAFDPVGSAVRLGPTRLVTARHVVADRETVTLYLPNGAALEAAVVPNDYHGDLVLLESGDLPSGPALEPGDAERGTTVHSVGADIGRQRIRAYAAGRIEHLPPADHSLARLHHSAYSQPGNSGGALVDTEGRLVGIVASGGEGRYEAIPSSALATLEQRSGPDFAAASAEIGTAVRVCTTLLEERPQGERLAEEQAKAIATSCRRSGNRQLLDLAGQTLGRNGRSEAAIALFELALAEDPNAVNTRIGLVITEHLAGDFEAALPHLHWLMDNAGDDLQVLRLAIQAGAWADDEPLARRALARLKEINPQMAPPAERFLENPPPRPPKR